jgi:hypothetical protein
VYFTALAARVRAGLVTPAMLAVDKRPLWVVGACEAASQLLFMISASQLPGEPPELLVCVCVVALRTRKHCPMADSKECVVDTGRLSFWSILF